MKFSVLHDLRVRTHGDGLGAHGHALPRWLGHARLDVATTPSGTRVSSSAASRPTAAPIAANPAWWKTLADLRRSVSGSRRLLPPALHLDPLDAPALPLRPGHGARLEGDAPHGRSAYVMLVAGTDPRARHQIGMTGLLLRPRADRRQRHVRPSPSCSSSTAAAPSRERRRRGRPRRDRAGRSGDAEGSDARARRDQRRESRCKTGLPASPPPRATRTRSRYAMAISGQGDATGPEPETTSYLRGGAQVRHGADLQAHGQARVKVTQQYPEEQTDLSPRWRGTHRMEVHADGAPQVRGVRPLSRPCARPTASGSWAARTIRGTGTRSCTRSTSSAASSAGCARRSAPWRPSTWAGTSRTPSTRATGSSTISTA